MRRKCSAIIVAVLALAGCGQDAADGAAGGEVPPPSTDHIAIVIPEAEDGTVAPGTIVELVYPGGETRGHSHFLQRWDGETWTDVYQVIASDPDQPFDHELIENAWAPAEEQQSTTDLGFEGSGGGQFTVIPPPTEPATYRICDEQRALCSAAFQVTD